MLKVKSKASLVKGFIATGLLSALVLLQACAEKRPETFAQGQGIDLETKAALDGRVFKLSTESVVKSVNMTEADRVSINSQKLRKEINSFGIVKYKTEAALLGDVPLVARPNTEYEVQYRLTDKYLKVYLIGRAEDIPFTQHPNSEKLDDGRLALPIVGYPVEYYHVENQLNSDREKTQTLIQVPESDPARATHVKVLYRSREVFQSVTKIDVYPANLFDGTWYYAETVVDTSIDQTTGIGATKSVDSSLSQATKIRFIKTGNSLRGVNVTIAKNIKQDEINYSTVIELPVEWKEFRTRRAGTDNSLSEEIVEDTPWNQRPYMQVKFDQIKTLSTEAKKRLDEEDDFGSSFKLDVFENSKLVDIEIDDNYIGFTIFRMSQGVRVKYSFLRVPEKNDYESRRYFKSDMKKFGFFRTVIPEVITWKMRRQEDIEKNFQISRFNPKHDIVFRFAKGTPERLKHIGREAVAAWDQAFQLAGVKAHVVLNEPRTEGSARDVSLGDLRYNVINLIESASGSNLFGFGPSIADSDTGEIISATANVHVTSIKEQVIDSIRDYIAHELGLLKGKNILAPIVTADTPEGIYFDGARAGNDLYFLANDLSPILEAKVDSQGNVRKQLPQFYRLDADSRLTTLTAESVAKRPSGFAGRTLERLGDRIASRGFGGCHDRSISLKNLDRTIAEKCPSLALYIDELKKSKRLYNSNEIQELDACAEIVMQDKILATLVHEMGHNLGLRHNFKGSVDKSNFHPKFVTSTNEVVNSSSVMEYTSFSESRLLIPGPYDIAAIRFGYAGQVLMNDDRTVKTLDSLRSIDEQPEAIASKMHRYAYCTDEDSMNGIDPMCRLHDAGTTPEEVVDFLIDEFRNTVANYAFRYDRIRSATAEGISAASLRTMVALKRFYDEWRFVVRDFVESKNEYLDSMTGDSYKATLMSMASNPDFASKLKLWRPAAIKAFQFLATTAQLPNRYCVLESGAGAEKTASVIELSQVREIVYKRSGQSVRHCRDEVARAEIEKDGARLVDEVGFFIDNTRYSMDIADMLEPFDAVGLAGVRVNAAMVLALRGYLSAKHLFTGFTPNFYDEPDMRNALVNMHQSRLFSGVVLNPKTLAETEGDAADRNYRVVGAPRFQKEAAILRAMNSVFKFAGYVPGHPSSSGAWAGLFRASTANNDEILKRDGAVDAVPYGNGYLDCLSKNAVMCLQVVKKIKSIRQLLTSPGKVESVNQLLQALNQAARDESETETMTLEEFVTTFQALVKKVQAVPAFGASEKLMELAEAFDGVNQKISALIETAGARSDEEAQAIFQANAKKTLKELGAKYPLTRANVNEYQLELKRVYELKEKQFAKAAVEADEYKAQQELLVDLLQVVND